MPQVIYVNASGERRVVDASVGDSVMATAVRNGVPGIVGECGGNRSCATCHVWVTDEFRDRVGPPEDIEDDMLDLGVSERRPGSRLSCQIPVSEEVDGLVVEVPPVQP